MLVDLGLSNIAWINNQFEEMGSLTWVVDPAKLADLLREYCISENAIVIDTTVDEVVI